MFSYSNQQNLVEQFILACTECNIEALNQSLDSGYSYSLIAANNYEGFRKAAENGHLAVINRLIEVLGEREYSSIHTMIASENYEGFRNAAKNDAFVHVLERLIEMESKFEKEYNRARANSYEDYSNPVANLQDMMMAEDYEAFRTAVQNNCQQVVSLMIRQVPEHVQDEMLFNALRWACIHANQDMVGRLVLLAQKPETIKKMFSANNFEVFFWAVEYQNQDIIQYVIDLAHLSDWFDELVVANDYEVFRNAVINGQESVICRLFAFSKPEMIRDMIKANDYEAFRHAESHNDEKLMGIILKEAPELRAEMDGYHMSFR